MFRSLLIASLLFVSGGLGSAWAQEDEFVKDPDNPDIQYRKKTEYDFEDDVVEGSFVRPEGDYINARRNSRHSSLIKIRKDFVDQLLKSAEDI